MAQTKKPVKQGHRKDIYLQEICECKIGLGIVLHVLYNDTKQENCQGLLRQELIQSFSGPCDYIEQPGSFLFCFPVFP